MCRIVKEAMVSSTRVFMLQRMGTVECGSWYTVTMLYTGHHDKQEVEEQEQSMTSRVSGVTGVTPGSLSPSNTTNE